VVAETTYQLLIDGTLTGRSVVSPADLKEWGAGHAICEGLLAAAQIAGVESEADRVVVRSRDGPPRGEATLPARVERSSGYLGTAEAGPLPPLTSDLRITPAQIEERARGLSELAPGWRQTGGLHVALLYDEHGQLLKVAEDVGRHNALDKVVGAAFLRGLDRTRCCVVISGRMPQGMIIKVVRAGIPIAITKAASTDLGIDIARRFNLTLICFARPGRFTIYSGEERVLL
jgi:FdhD protein